MSVLLGGGISIWTILIKNRSPKHGFLRLLILFIAHFGTIALNGRLGTILYLDKLFGIANSEATGRVAGLVMVFFLICVFGVGIAANMILAIVGMVKNGFGNSTGGCYFCMHSPLCYLIFGEKWHTIDTENTYAMDILWLQGGSADELLCFDCRG